MRIRRGVRAASIGVAVMGLTLGPLPMAFAEGPGYGGDAGQLAVSWELAPADVAPAEPAPADSAPAQPAPAEPAPADSTPVALSLGGAARGVAAVVILPPTADPKLESDALALIVRGLGFRGKSEIEVRIGSDQPVIARADTAGSLTVALDPAKLGGAEPGVSVMAVGRNQSGTQVALFGSIPPVADGSGPMTVVPWAVGSVALVGLAVWMRRRHSRSA